LRNKYTDCAENVLKLTAKDLVDTVSGLQQDLDKACAIVGKAIERMVEVATEAPGVDHLVVVR
jgi:hypothetical protein